MLLKCLRYPKKRLHIVFTTIHHPVILESLVENAKRYNRLDQAKVWVVGDRKTPESARTAAETATQAGLETVYLSPEDQDAWWLSLREPLDSGFYARLPWNSDSRRNIGYLCALEDRCGAMLALDDDNFPAEDDLIGTHLDAYTLPERGGIRGNLTSYHYCNPCDFLKFEGRAKHGSGLGRIFSRGYPPSDRHAKPNYVAKLEDVGLNHGRKLAALQGLWLGDPDCDAATWLSAKPKSLGMVGARWRYVLHRDTWMPINSQNTSVAREMIPAFMFVPESGQIRRYGDILAGYILQAAIDCSEWRVAFGRPLVDHRRNSHDYLRDLRDEHWGLQLMNWLTHGLKTGWRARRDRVTDRVLAVADRLEVLAPTRPEWAPPEIEDFLHTTAATLRDWIAACRMVGPQ